MTCELLDECMEAIAEGLAPDGAAAAHLEACAACRQRLALARGLLRTLEAREVPLPPGDFTDRVMARVRQDQWRAEQWVDAGFNAAVAAGLGLMAAGLAGLAGSFGWVSIDAPAVAALSRALAPWVASAVAEAQTVAIAAVLLTSALGLWWWAEEDEASL